MKKTPTDVQHWVGVDVAKASLEVFVDSRRLTFENSNEGIATLVHEIAPFDKVRVIFEATGGYESLLIDVLTSSKVEFARVNPRQVRDFAKAKNRLAKTDRIDAEILADFGACIEPALTVVPDDVTLALQDLVNRRRQLVDMSSMEQTRLKQARAQRLIKSIQATLAFLAKQIEKLDSDIDSTCRRLPEFDTKDAVMRTLKGVGPVTRSTLLALVPELGKLRNRQIASLIGLAPFNDDSGNGKGRRLTRGGRQDVRDVLYMAAMSARLHDPQIRDFYQRLIAKGKDHKLALIACMRKMIVILNARLRDAFRPFTALTVKNA
jgi:transposase